MGCRKVEAPLPRVSGRAKPGVGASGCCRRPVTPARPMASQMLKNRLIEGRHPMIRSVVHRDRRMTWQATTAISRMTARTPWRRIRSRIRCVVLGLGLDGRDCPDTLERLLRLRLVTGGDTWRTRDPASATATGSAYCRPRRFSLPKRRRSSGSSGGRGRTARSRVSGAGAYRVKSGKPQPYCCRDCRKYFSLKRNTAMGGSPLPLRDWG